MFLKVFGLEVARTGLGRAEIDRLGLSATVSVSTSVHQSRGHVYPGSKPITTVLLVEPERGRFLGGPMAGAESVSWRIDVLATALHAGMTVAEIELLDLAYAPPWRRCTTPSLSPPTWLERLFEPQNQSPHRPLNSRCSNDSMRPKPTECPHVGRRHRHTRGCSTR